MLSCSCAGALQLVTAAALEVTPGAGSDVVVALSVVAMLEFVIVLVVVDLVPGVVAVVGFGSWSPIVDASGLASGIMLK